MEKKIKEAKEKVVIEEIINKSMDKILINQKYTDFLFYSLDLIRKFPKSENFALVTEIKSTIYSGFKCLIHAIKVYDKPQKLAYLHELDIQLMILKMYIRLSYKYQYITMQNYSTWSKKLTDICNMLGRWITSCVKK